MIKQIPNRVLTAAVVGAACLALGLPQQAQAADRECVKACLDVQGDCLQAARELVKECKDESGCADLRAVARELCEPEVGDQEACDEARAAVRECVESCREPAVLCMEEAATCLNEGCNVELFCPKRKPQRPRPPRRD